MADPYQLLGVAKAASADELKSAYRKLAKKLHPDVNPGRKDIEQKFKEVTAAYDLLSDKDKRARFDRGEIDGQGNERGFSGGNPFGSGGGNPFGGRGGRNYSYTSTGGSSGEDPFAQYGMEGMEDILSEFLGGQRGTGNGNAGGRARRGGPKPPPSKGADIVYSVTVPFIEAAKGGKRRLTLTGGKTIDVTVPSGTKDSDKLRLKGLGEQAMGGPGDAIIEIRVEPHAWFTRIDQNIALEAPISLIEALTGSTITVPTLDGHVTVKVPKNANTGTTLRLKGKGIPGDKPEDSGDMLVKLKIMLPEQSDEELAELVEKWGKKHAYDPRKKLGW